MSALIDRTGEIYRELQITEELGGAKVKCKCLNCGVVEVYNKTHVVKMASKCKHCGKYSSLDNKTGELYRILKITEEIGYGQVKCRCIKCGHEGVHVKKNVLRETALCKNCEKPKTRFIDRTGEIHRSLQIIEDKGNTKVKCKCIKCGSIDTYTKHNVSIGGALCTECETRQTKLINRVGEIHRDLKIIDEIGGGKVKCQCIKCKAIDTYFKQSIVNDETLCKHCGQHCGKHRHNVVNRVGETHNNFKIIEECGSGEVKVKCTICKDVSIKYKNKVITGQCSCKVCTKQLWVEQLKNAITSNDRIDIKRYSYENKQIEVECKACKGVYVYSLSYIEKHTALCKNTECDNSKSPQLISYVDKVFNGLKILKELGSSKVIATCTCCGDTAEYDKRHVINGRAICKSSQCTDRAKKLVRKSLVGGVFGTLEIIQELGYGKAKFKCTLCDHIDTYSKWDTVYGRIQCNKCSVKKRKLVNNVIINELAYTGRDGNKYYSCTCTKCGEELFLTREKIVSYKCIKVG